jgi:hypothetical protein
MSPTAIKALYLAAWLGVAVVVIHLAMAAGHSFWLAALLAYAIFFFVNGSLAYRVRARQLREQGEQPPPFLVYLLFPRSFSLREKVRVPRPVRLVLGIVIIVGGVFFVATGTLILANLDFSKIAHPLGAVVMLVALSVLGLAIAFVGWRLMVVKNEDPLFKRLSPNKTKTDAA